MRLVRLNDLSEEERKKALEEQNARIQTNRQASEQIRVNANNEFNDYVSKNGSYDTSKHTFKMNDLLEAKKAVSKESYNSFKKANGLTLWDTIKQTANDTGKLVENTWIGLDNGVKSFKQTLGRAITNTQADRADFWNEQNEEMLKKIAEENPEQAERIKEIIENPLISGEQIRRESEETTSKIQKEKEKNTNKIQENADSIDNPVGKYLAGNIMPSIGQMAPGLIGGGIGTTYFIGSATGNYYDDAKQRGMTEDEATIYSSTMGIIEGSLEALGAKLTTNVGKNLLKKNIKGALVNYGLDISENFLEESIVEPISEIVAQTTAGKDKANWENIGQRFLQSGIDGAVTSIITGGLSGISGTVASTSQNNKYTDINTGKLLDKKSQNWLSEAENIINNSNISKEQSIIQNNTNLSSQQQIANQKNKMVQNGISELKNILPIQNFIYEKSDNPRINNLRQDASKYWSNTEKTKNYVNMLEKIIQDKNIDIRLDANLKDSKGNIANGSYSNGVITINPNSTRAGEFIAIHELTHAIGTNQMRNIVQKYRESNIEFDTAVNSLLQNYNTTELTEEAMADVAGQLFGNQEFINNLAKTEPNIFKKIYNEIKYLWHQFTGYKNQDQFINDLQYKWEQAYINNAKLNETTNYYIEPVAKFDETEYNNIVEEKLRKQEYAILRSIINSDSNIKPGINYVEVTNGRYTVYYKGLDDFKVMSRKVDADAGRINKRNDATGRKTRYSKTFEQSIGNEGTTASNDEISNFNTTGTRERSRSNSSSSTNIENGIKLPTKESENNSGSFSFDKNAKRYEDLLLSNTISYNKRNNGVLNIEILNDNELINQISVDTKEETIKQLGDNIGSYIYESANEKNQSLKLRKQEKNKRNPVTHKEKQLDIINNTNAMLDDYHTGIRSVNDIKMFEETINDGESFAWGDFSKEDAENALEEGKITIYSSYPIKQGTFISTSKIQAEEYAGGRGKKVYSKTIPLDEVAWINGDEGQYAKVNEKYSLPTKEWQQHLEENYKSTGTRINLQDIKLPTKQNTTKLPTKENTKTSKVKFESDNLIQESNKISNEETAQILTEIKGRTNEKRKMSAFLKANLIDKGMVFEELARKTNNRDLQGKYDYTLTAEARGQNAIGNARYDYQTTVEDGKIKKGDKNAKQISKSLTDIINEVGEDPTDFYNYMYHQLNIDRMTLEERFGGDTGTNYERKNTIKNKPVFGKGVTADISQKYVQELEQKHPEFKEYAQDVYDFLDANTKELVDNGIISKETQQLFKEMYPHYVPISRITNKGQAINVPLDTGRTGVNSPIKRAKGGNRDINPLFQTMADRTLQTYRASARNNFGIELKNTLDQAKQLNQTTELTDIDSIMESMTDEEQNNNLLQEGVNGENPTFTVFENGEKVTYEISKDMYDALKPKNELLKRIDNSMLSKGLNKVNNFRRGLLTEYNPVFSITNAIKDVQDVLLNSQHSAKTYSKIPEATAQILSKGYWYKEYIQNGGEQNSYFRDGEFDVTKKTLPTKTKEVVTLPLKAISSVNNVIEMTPRLAEYIVSRQQGRSIETSMLDASRVTTNFKAGGDVIKTLNRNGFTFLNASVQGMQQQIRNIQEANSKGLKGYAVLATKYAIAGLPVLILNNLIWDDDDDYEELQDYVKDNYYIIGKSKDGTFIRIPKGRAVATIQKIVSNANDFIKNDTINSDEVGKVFWEDLKENVSFAKDNLAPNNPLDNNVIAPITQVMSNKTWYGDALVPTRLQDKPKEEQYDETTDEISKWIGKHLKVSPMKVNYLLDQYSGGVGDILLPKLTPQAENTVLEDKFTTNPIMKNKYPGEFFEKIDELTVNKNSDKATDEDKLKYKYMSSLQNEMNDLYKEKREIQNSKATDEEKKKQLKELQKKINDLARNSLDKVEKITKGKNYAQIDTNQYYKDVEGNWEKVSEKDKEKNKESGLSLKTYSSYKYEMSKVKQEKVNKGEMTEEQSLKDNEQIQILLDSSYSDKDKSIIYEDYIKSSVKEGEYDSFEVIKASGININEYLKYEQQEFKSDKKDDGTLDGKTVSKSKQKKVESYLNSMNIEGNQRLLLYAMQGYSTTNSQKTQLANYVYGLNLDKETKLELYNKFSGFKVYKDGKVQW